MILEFEFTGGGIRGVRVITYIDLATYLTYGELGDSKYISEHDEWEFEHGDIKFFINVTEGEGFKICIRGNLGMYEAIMLGTVLESVFEEVACVKQITYGTRVMEDFTISTVTEKMGMSERQYMDLWKTKIEPVLARL